jgi:hypothetical protein
MFVAKRASLELKTQPGKKLEKLFVTCASLDVSVIEFVVKSYHVDSHW